MGLFSLGQRFFDGARQLLNMPQTLVDGQQQQKQPGALERFGIFNFGSSTTGSVKAADTSLRQLSERVQVGGQDGRKQTTAPKPIRAPQLDPSGDDQPTRKLKPYTVQILLPKGQEKAGYDQLQRAVIRDVFSHHGIYTSRAAVEDFIKTNGNSDLNEQAYKNEQGKIATTKNKVPGIMAEVQDIPNKVTGEIRRGYELTITVEYQKAVLDERKPAEAITKAGTKVVPELTMNERLSKAMQIAYDKHLPHTVGEAVRDVDPKQLMVGVAVAGGVVAAASKAGASKLIPYVGAAVTMTQLTSYHAEAQAFVKMCAEAKTDADLDKAAQQFASVVKQGGIDVILTAGTVGVGKLGAISKAGGKLVGEAAQVADDAARAAMGKFAQWNDEIVAGAKRMFGEDLALQNVPNRTTTGAPNGRGSNVFESRANGFPGIRIPSSNGSWTGEVGRSGWKSTKPEVIAATGGKPIEYKDGFPDFSPWRQGKVELENMKGDYYDDFNDADNLYAKQQKWFKADGETPDGARVKKLREDDRLTWHHHQDMTTMELVPKDINNEVSHTGGASFVKKTNFKGNE